MNGNRQKWIITGCTGLLAGIISSLLVLYILQINGFHMRSLSYVFILVMAFFLPLCLRWTDRYGVSLKWAQVIMVVLHLLITTLYAVVVTTSGSSYYLLVSTVLTGIAEGAGVISSETLRYLTKKQHT